MTNDLQRAADAAREALANRGVDPVLEALLAHVDERLALDELYQHPRYGRWQRRPRWMVYCVRRQQPKGACRVAACEQLAKEAK